MDAAVADPPAPQPLPASLSQSYEHVVSGVWDGWQPISLYPYTLVEDGRRGLALASDLSAPRLVKLAYDQQQRRLEGRSYLGISPRAEKLDGRADVRFELYRVDPKWGFRAAMERFARRHPEWFETPRGAHDFVGYERGHYAGEDGAREVLAADRRGVFSAEYIVAEGVLQAGPVSEPMPSYDDTLQLVEDARNSTNPAIRARGEAIARSVLLDPAGGWQLKHVGEYDWAPGVWEACWATSTDPDIAEGWGPAMWEGWIDPAITATEAIGAVLDGVMMDNFMSAPAVDVGPEHLALADTPLAYSVATYQPGVHNAANVHEFLSWLRQRLDDRGRRDMAITINFWGIGDTNGLLQHVDALGGEGESTGPLPTNWNPHILDYRRAMAYHKPQAWSNGGQGLTTDEARQFADLALFYAIFPQRKSQAGGWEPGADEVISDTVGVLQQFWSDGWEPVTHAWADSEAVWVERYGADEASRVTFSVHNTAAEETTFVLTIDLAALGISVSPGGLEGSPGGARSVAVAAPTALRSDDLTVIELVSDETVPLEVQDGLATVRGRLPARGTLVYQLRVAPGAQPWTAYVPYCTRE